MKPTICFYQNNKTRRSYIYLLPIAGLTAGPNWAEIFVDTHGWPGGVKGEKNPTFFFKLFFQFFFHGHCRALQLAYFQSLNKSTKGSIYFFVR